MSTWVEEMALHSEGFTDEEIAQIDAVREDALHIWATFQAVLPRLERVAPVVRMVLERLNFNQKAGQI